MNKLKLNNIKIESFVTSLDEAQAETLKGGVKTGDCSGVMCLSAMNCSTGCTDCMPGQSGFYCNGQ